MIGLLIEILSIRDYNIVSILETVLENIGRRKRTETASEEDQFNLGKHLESLI